MRRESDRPRGISGSRAHRLHLGLIGFGQLAQRYYVPALRDLSQGLEISVADPLERSRAAARRALPGASIYEDHRELLARGAPDAVLVASPPSSHLEIWLEAAERELPVFMEKPFPMAAELERIDPTDRAWQNLMIDFNRRFWPSYRDLSRQLASGSVGRVSQALFTLHIDSSAWASVSDHRADPGEGGVLHDLGSHALDLVLTTFGEQPSEILAKRSNHGTPRERVELELAFESGLVVGCDLAYGRNREQVLIRGEGGSLRLENPNGRVWLERRRSRLGEWSRACVDLALLGYRGAFRGRSMLRYSVSASIRSFLRAVVGNAAFQPDFSDAYRVALWMAAAARSVELDRAVAPEGIDRVDRHLPSTDSC